MRTDVILAVKDVEASSRWYQKLLGCRSAHGGPFFEILAKDHEVILLLHQQDAPEHEFSVDTSGEGLGRGVSVSFTVDALDDVGAVHKQALALGARVLAEAHCNEQAGHTELEIQDPDGYFLSVCHRDVPLLPETQAS